MIMPETGMPTTSECIPLLSLNTQHDHHDFSAPSSPLQENECPDAAGEMHEYKNLPRFIWFLLKFTGINNRLIVTKTQCHLCHLSAIRRQHQDSGVASSGFLYPGTLQRIRNEEGPLTCVVDINLDETDDGSRTVACVVCQREWLDARGRCRPYLETDIGVRKWSHRGSTIFSIIWPLTLIALIMFDFFFYLGEYWGQEKHILRLISYSTFLLFNMSTPVLSLTANIYNMLPSRCLSFRWYNALSARYIVKRLQHLELGERGLPYKAFLVVCLIWPCLNGFYRIIIYYGIVKSRANHINIHISLDVGLVCMLLFGAFCYLMLLLRLSLQKQLPLELSFLRRHVGALDVCRRQLAIYAEELGSMVRLVSIWIIFVFAVSTWAFTTQISWNYLLMSNATVSESDTPLDLIIQYNIYALIWSENVMFLSLPLVAVGGIGLNGTWVQLRRSISQMRCETHEEFWDKIMAFCKEQSPKWKVKFLTLMSSALGLILGLKFAGQNVAYWNGKK